MPSLQNPPNKEFQYYLAHQDEIVRKHNGKCVVIKGCRVVGVFTDELTAFLGAWKKYKDGAFIVQQVSPGAEAYTHTLHSCVALAGCR